MDNVSELDIQFINRAVKIALQAEQKGNLPIGSLIVLDGRIISEGGNAVRMPEFHPGRHAEMEALKGVQVHLWPQSGNMICYTTLEPCVMCFGSLLLHGIGKIVFGAYDLHGGSSVLLDQLPDYYDDRSKVPEFVGPVLEEKCKPLYERAAWEYGKLSRS